jgi:uncharacterized membrane protein YphA (DoxX/SURF4 family)
VTAAGIGYASAVLLAIVFVVAAVAKLRDRPGTEASFVDLDLPHAARFATVVPVAELAIAALLVLLPFVGGLAAVTTLAFFTTFLVTRLRAGLSPPCACFGRLRREPLSPANIVGNAFLVVAACAATLATTPVVPAAADLALVTAGVIVEIAVHAAVRSRASASTTTTKP